MTFEKCNFAIQTRHKGKVEAVEVTGYKFACQLPDSMDWVFVGVYFRVKRGDGFMPVCWTDLTDDERERFGANRPATWWKSMAEHLAKRLRYVGDELDIEFVYEEGGE